MAGDRVTDWGERVERFALLWLTIVGPVALGLALVALFGRIAAELFGWLP